MNSQYLQYALDFSICARYKLLKTQGDNGEKLSKLYDLKPKCFSYIAKIRRDANNKLSVCPYCGLPGKLTLDHYLPRAPSFFPQFSSLSSNLVPACHGCQSAKGTFHPLPSRRPALKLNRQNRSRVIQDTPLKVALKRAAQRGNILARKQICAPSKGKRILHPYFDRFLTAPIWKLVIEDPSRPVESASLGAIRSTSLQTKLVAFHIRKLRIADRLPKVVEGLVVLMSSQLRKSGALNPVDALIEISRMLDSTQERDRTPNSLDCVVLRGMVYHPALLNAVLARAALPGPTKALRSQGVAF